MPDELPVFNVNVTLIVNMIYTTLVQKANDENEKSLLGVEWILDEFGNFPPFNNIQNMVSISRSRGMKFHFFIQSFSQLYNMYGKEVSQIILDNCGLIFLKTNNLNTAVEISKRLGKRTLESQSLSYNSSREKNFNINKNLIGRDLMTPNEIENLRYKTIIFPVKGFPIFRKTIVYEKIKQYVAGMYERSKTKMENAVLINLENILNENKLKIQVEKLIEIIEEESDLKVDKFEYMNNGVKIIFVDKLDLVQQEKLKTKLGRKEYKMNFVESNILMLQ